MRKPTSRMSVTPRARNTPTAASMLAIHASTRSRFPRRRPRSRLRRRSRSAAPRARVGHGRRRGAGTPGARAALRSRTCCRRSRRGVDGASGRCSIPKQRACVGAEPQSFWFAHRALVIYAYSIDERAAIAGVPVAVSIGPSIASRSSRRDRRPLTIRASWNCVVLASDASSRPLGGGAGRRLAAGRRATRRASRSARPRCRTGATVANAYWWNVSSPSARSQSTSCSRRLRNRCTGLVAGRRARCAATSASDGVEQLASSRRLHPVELHELDVGRQHLGLDRDRDRRCPRSRRRRARSSPRCGSSRGAGARGRSCSARSWS